jgi:hypothetical protein
LFFDDRILIRSANYKLFSYQKAVAFGKPVFFSRTGQGTSSGGSNVRPVNVA